MQFLHITLLSTENLKKLPMLDSISSESIYERVISKHKMITE